LPAAVIYLCKIIDVLHMVTSEACEAVLRFLTLAS
jgi:hypothetical protein